MLRLLAALLLTLPVLPAQTPGPLRVLAIGDSLTEEYAFEIIFSAPDSDPGNANARNWPELFRIFRPNEVSFGPYRGTVASYIDLRNGGHEWNFGVPSFTTLDFVRVLATDSYNPLTDNAQDLLYFRTRSALIGQLPAAQAVVIFLGGNDLKQDYDDILLGTEATGFFTTIVNRLAVIHDWVRLRNPAVSIVICTVPDVGATPQIAANYTDPVLSPAARAKVAAMNAKIVSMAADKGAAVARIDRLTDRIFDEDPFHINGTPFIFDGAPSNPPDRVFCKDNFHPGTVGQALIANEIIAALNQAAGRDIPPFAGREILLNLLALDPDRPYLDWLAGFPGATGGMDDDPDGDGLPNLVEMALGTPPDQRSTPVAGSWRPGSSLAFTPDPAAALYLDLIPEESTDLLLWTPVPQERIGFQDEQFIITPPDLPAGYHRLNARPKP